MSEMTKEEMVRIAKRAVDKGWDYETLKYGDDMYGREDMTDEVWELVEECKTNGARDFYTKYPD